MGAEVTTADPKCPLCGGTGVVETVLWEPHVVRVRATRTTVREETRFRDVVVKVPCECVGGIVTLLLGPEPG